MAKKLTSLRISEYTEAQVHQLAERLDCTHSELMAMAIDRMYRDEFGRGINPLPPEQYQAALERSRLKRKAKE